MFSQHQKYGRFPTPKKEALSVWNRNPRIHGTSHTSPRRQGTKAKKSHQGPSKQGGFSNSHHGGWGMGWPPILSCKEVVVSVESWRGTPMTHHPAIERWDFSVHKFTIPRPRGTPIMTMETCKSTFNHSFWVHVKAGKLGLKSLPNLFIFYICPHVRVPWLNPLVVSYLFAMDAKVLSIIDSRFSIQLKSYHNIKITFFSLFSIISKPHILFRE